MVANPICLCLSLPSRCRARNLQHTPDEFNQRSAGVLSLNCFRIGSDAPQLTVGLVSGGKNSRNETQGEIFFIP